MEQKLQLELVQEEDREDVLLLLPAEQRRKHCTGGQAEKLEWKRDAILALIGSGWPVRSIKQVMRVSEHTILVLARRNAEKVATFSLEYADALLKKGADLLTVGLLKAEDLSPMQAFMAHGIVTDKALAIKAVAGTGEVGEKESVKQEEDRAKRIAELRRYFGKDEPEAGSADLPSAAGERDGKGLPRSDAQRSTDGATEAGERGPVPPPSDGGGGGSDGGAMADGPMGEPSGESSPKGAVPPQAPADDTQTKKTAPQAQGGES